MDEEEVLVRSTTAIHSKKNYETFLTFAKVRWFFQILLYANYATGVNFHWASFIGSKTGSPDAVVMQFSNSLTHLHWDLHEDED